MGAQIGPRDDGRRFDVAPGELLQQVTGISPETEGKHVLQEDAGYKACPGCGDPGPRVRLM
jgi:hypothetical protein